MNKTLRNVLIVLGVLLLVGIAACGIQNALKPSVAATPAVVVSPASTSQPAQPPVVGVVKLDFSDITNYKMNVDELIPVAAATVSVTTPSQPAPSASKTPMSPEMRRRYQIWVERK